MNNIASFFANHFHFFTQIIKDNPWMLGAFSVMGVGGAVAWLRNLPGQIIKLITGRFIVSITINDDMVGGDIYQIINYLTKNNVYLNDKLKHSILNYIVKQKGKAVAYYLPSTGTHLFWHKNYPIWLQYSKKERTGSEKYITGYTFSTFALNINFLKDFISKSAEEYYNSIALNKKRYLYTIVANGWMTTENQILKKKELSSLCLEDNALSLVPDIELFLSREKWYNEVNIPYHRGYLLHGVPGCGKSTIVQALAAKFEYSIAYMNLNSLMVNDNSIQYIFRNIPNKTFLIMEDVDAAFSTSEMKKNDLINNLLGDNMPDDSKREAKSNLSFSSFLNVLDGLMARDGLIYFMTTNHREKLDPALIRPGRIDKEVYFDYASKNQIKNIFLKFFPNEEDKANTFCALLYEMKLSMAQLQGYFICHMDDVDKALFSVHELQDGNENNIGNNLSLMEYEINSNDLI